MADCDFSFVGPASVIASFRLAIAAFTGPSEAAWQGFERLLRHALAEWESRPRHRDPVFERDKWRCRVGPCSRRRDLHDHHRRFRSRGGSNEQSNRTSSCWVHHNLIHAGFIRGYGCAPDGLVWELGVRPGRPPLLVLEGDRYVTRKVSGS